MIVKSDEIKNLLPHREPFLFVDKCEIKEVGIKGVGNRKFLPNEFFFKGHFPELPIVPGVILIEALAQTAGIVISKAFENEEHKSVLFMTVSDAKFRKPVIPNDDICFEVEKLNNVKSVYKFYGLAKNNSTKVCEAKFSAMIINKSYSEIF